MKFILLVGHSKSGYEKIKMPGVRGIQVHFALDGKWHAAAVKSHHDGLYISRLHNREGASTPYECLDRTIFAFRR